MEEPVPLKTEVEIPFTLEKLSNFWLLLQNRKVK